MADSRQLSEKRVVFVHDDGIHQILGLVQGKPPATLAADGAVIQTRGRTIPFASLVRVTKRIAFYKAPMVPKSYGSMHPEQR